MKNTKRFNFYSTIILFLMLGHIFYLFQINNTERNILKSAKSNYYNAKDLKEFYSSKIEKKIKEIEKNKPTKIYAYVTAFNTVPWQTDSTPCQAKFGYICGRDDVVACPRDIPAFTKVEILNKEYECMDWLSIKYPNRFDISFDKDILGAKEFGINYLEVLIYEQN